MNTAEILERIRDLRVLVVGDICLDRWCWYDPALELASAETGIPRTGVVRVEVTPGAGGTVSNNLAALGVGKVDVLGVAGRDGFGWELREALSVRGIGHEHLLQVDGLQTFTYTKLINATNDVEDLARVDFVNTRALSEDVDLALVYRFNNATPDYDVVIVSDQAETSAGGVVSATLRGAIESFAQAHPNVVVWVDSRTRAELFQGVIIKPNEKEAREACERAFGAVDFARLRAHCEAPLLFVTQGGNGVRIFSPVGEASIRTTPEPNPVDICGAGDSFTAGAATAYAVTRDAETAARFGNKVASITIMKKGTGTASPDELRAKE